MSLKKILPIFAISAAMLLVAGVMITAVHNAAAARPSDYGLKEGDTISAAGSSDPDVYIVNDAGYKRLFLNPAIFGFYGHLGGFANVKHVSAATRDAFMTSGLFRNCETNDQKVYGVETTGEDTGTLHWVNTTGAQAVADDPNFFLKVFCINSNEFNWYAKDTNYTSVKQVPNYARQPGQPDQTPPPVYGTVTVGLASDNPASTVIVSGASGVTYLKLNFSGTGTISSLTVTRHGPGRTADFSNLYLYDGPRRLTYGRSVNSSSGKATFTGVNIAINGSRTISVVADLASSLAGYVDNFSVDNASDVVLSGGTVEGSFPISGNAMAYSNATIGQLAIANSGAAINPTIGQANVEMAEFKFTANTEGARIGRLQLYQAGTVQPVNISNLRLQVNGSTIANASAMTSDGYAVFDMSSNPLFIAKGDNRIVQVYGDVGSNARRDETIKLYIEQDADVFSVGDQLGYGMSISGSFADDSTIFGVGGSALTLQGGIITLSFIGPTATNVSTTTTKTHFLDFDINSAANVEVRKTTIVMCRDLGGNGTYDSAPSVAASVSFGDVNNIQIINRDTNVALVGPADGSAFTTLSDNTSLSNGSSDAGACGSTFEGMADQFTDVWSLAAGQTLHLAIVGDVKTNNTTTGNDLQTGDAIKAVLYGLGTAVQTNGSTAYMRYTGTNTAVKSADIVPTTAISGPSFTIQGSSLAAALASTPNTSQTFVKGTQNVTALGINLAAGLGNPVTVNTLSITGYRGASAHVSMTAGDTTGLVSAVRLVDSATDQTVGTVSGNNLSTTGNGKVQFTNMNYSIAGGVTKTLLVKVDLGGNTPGTTNTIAFDIGATTDVSATDQNSTTVNVSPALINGDPSSATGATTYITVASSGTLAVALAADSATSAPVYWGQTDTMFSKFKLTSTNEGFYVERLNLYTADTAASLTANIDTLKVSYLNKVGSPLTATGTPNSAGSASFAFDGNNRPYVPKDGTLYVTVSANIKTAATLFRRSGVNFSVDLSGTAADEFRAVGEGSGAVITGTTTGAGSTAATTAGNNLYVYRSYPQFTYIGTPATTIGVGQEVLKFKIDAMGLQSDGATVFFDGLTGRTSGSVKFAVYASGSNTAASASLGFDLRRVLDSSGNSVNDLVASRTLLFTATGATCTYANCAADFNNNSGKAASASFRFRDATANTSIEIPAGSSNTFVLRLNAVTGFSKIVNTSTGRSADYVYVQLRNVAPGGTGETYWTDKGGVDRNKSLNSVANILKSLPITGSRVNFQ